MSLDDSSIHHLERQLLMDWPAEKWSSMTIVVACSGGADSTALLLALSRAKHASTTIKVAHFNHQLRGEESDRDEAFVRDLAQSLNFECFIQRASELEMQPAPNPSASESTSEDALRKNRYAFFERCANQVGGRYVVLAHTADDQAETLVHRWCRGSGLSGLAGIPMFRALGRDIMIARPLLNVWRIEVLEYLKLLGQAYCTDRTNVELQYTRNRIRNLILPQLEECVHPAAKKNLVESADSIREVYEYIRAQTRNFIDQRVVFRDNVVTVDLAALSNLGPMLGKEVLREIWSQMGWPMGKMTKVHWENLYGFSTASVQTQRISTMTDFPGEVRVRVFAGNPTDSSPRYLMSLGR